MNRPKLHSGSLVAEESDAAVIKFFGGAVDGSVAFSRTQVDVLTKFYGTENPCRGEEIEALAEAYSWRDTARAASTDGLRLMAFLAKHGFLEEGVDPVRSMATALQQDYFCGSPPDHWNEEDEDE